MELPSFLRYLLLVHFVIAMVYGAWYFFLPQSWVDLTGWPYSDPAAYRVLAALLIAFGIGSLLAYRVNSWEKVEILVIIEIIWLAMGSIGLLWAMFENLAIPIAGRVNLAVMVMLLIFFLYAYYDVREMLKPEKQSPLRS
ncbi:MAG: hypothetical protein ACXABV_20005 [Candidatus Thorarchaeota archaeon]|jgi:hypothetical protein